MGPVILHTDKSYNQFFGGVVYKRRCPTLRGSSAVCFILKLCPNRVHSDREGVWNPLPFSKQPLGPILTVWNASGKAQSASSFVGGSTALSLFYRRINDACAAAQASKGLVWSSLITRRCGLGVTCNKPMRVPAPIPFKSHERIWIGRVDILTARLQSPMRQMHMNLQMA